VTILLLFVTPGTTIMSDIKKLIGTQPQVCFFSLFPKSQSTEAIQLYDACYALCVFLGHRSDATRRQQERQKLPYRS
jgi:hypothetical protein